VSLLPDADESRLNRFERKLDDIQSTMVKRDDFVRLIDKVDQAVPRTEYDSRHNELRSVIERVEQGMRAGFDAATLARDAAAQVLKSEFDKEFEDHEVRLRGLESSRIPERVFLASVAIVSALIGIFGGHVFHP
jgi:hypothetical protein